MFLIGVPVMLLLRLLGPLLLPEFRDPHAGRLDPLSAGMSLATVIAEIYGLKQMAANGVDSAALLSIAAGLAIGLLFIRRQYALRDPLMDLRLFRVPAFRAALTTNRLDFFLGFGVLLFVAQYLQLVIGLAPLHAGLWSIPSACGVIVGSMLTPIVARHVRPSVAMAGGLVVTAGGFFLLTQLGGASALAVLVTGSTITSLGLAPVTTLATDIMAAEESLPRLTRADRGPTPFTYTFRAGAPISLTEFASPSVGGELKIRPDLAIFVQDQWKHHRFTINLGLRYEYHRVYADSLTTPAGPLVDAHDLPRVDCIPCWHDLDPRFGVAWDVFGDGKTALKASIRRYVALASYVQSRTFAPQNAIVASTSRSWSDANGNLIPDCDLRNPSGNGECGPMANRSFGQSLPVTTPDPNWIRGWGNRGFSWAGSLSIDHELRPGVAVSAGYYRTVDGSQIVTRNQATTPADYDPYCITAPIDSRLPQASADNRSAACMTSRRRRSAS